MSILAELSGWFWLVPGGFVLTVVVVVGTISQPHKTNKHADHHWRD